MHKNSLQLCGNEQLLIVKFASYKTIFSITNITCADIPVTNLGPMKNLGCGIMCNKYECLHACAGMQVCARAGIRASRSFVMKCAKWHFLSVFYAGV